MEYAVQSQIPKRSTFAWWIPQVIKKRKQIIAKAIKEAKYFDTENGNTLWWHAILKEMANVK